MEVSNRLTVWSGCRSTSYSMPRFPLFRPYPSIHPSIPPLSIIFLLSAPPSPSKHGCLLHPVDFLSTGLAYFPFYPTGRVLPDQPCHFTSCSLSSKQTKPNKDSRLLVQSSSPPSFSLTFQIFCGPLRGIPIRSFISFPAVHGLTAAS